MAAQNIKIARPVQGQRPYQVQNQIIKNLKDGQKKLRTTKQRSGDSVNSSKNRDDQEKQHNEKIQNQMNYIKENSNNISGLTP